jgi:hypothetical protein
MLSKGALYINLIYFNHFYRHLKDFLDTKKHFARLKFRETADAGFDRGQTANLPGHRNPRSEAFFRGETL